MERETDFQIAIRPKQRIEMGSFILKIRTRFTAVASEAAESGA